MVQELRITLRNAGIVDPESIDDYINANGYKALEKARALPSEDLISEVEKSGKLRGRGGAGFNTGLKWRSAAQAKAEQKYVICNADEGEPGTYKDRVILEGDPHSVIEGMLVCAHAIGATEGYIYCRGEYKHIIDLLKRAICQVKEKGFDEGIDLHVVSGAGSYVCGEETALIESLEGKRGEPRLKPPYPTVEGFRGMPTVVNNVETFATIPSIIENGADWFKEIGAKKYPGTKIFALSGDVKNRTHAEVPTDTLLIDIINDVGGGVAGKSKIKAVQVGGSSCGFLTGEMLDTPADFDSMSRQGASLGSGSVFVIDESRNILEVLLPIVDFFKNESCGKCVPCREGTARMADAIWDIANGKGTEAHIDFIKELSEYMQSSSFCPLGQSATVAVMSALKYFVDDFNSKIEAKEGAAND